MSTVTLRGITWDHPRGYQPLVKGAALFESKYPELRIEWEKRSLREFSEASLEQYVAQYDLLIIDHSYVGFAAAAPCLLDLSTRLSRAQCNAFAADSIGASWNSYWYQDKLWALPIDAATQVAASRPDLISADQIPSTFEEVLALAKAAHRKSHWVAVAGFPTDAISLVISFAADLGYGIVDDTEMFLPKIYANEIFRKLQALIAQCHPSSIGWNAIAVYNYMSRNDDVIYCPFAYGYTNYSREGFHKRLAFHNAPGLSVPDSAHTQLGGTGIAVNASSKHLDIAVNYALWLCSIEHQSGAYYRLGGQPASLAAWQNPVNDKNSGSFFSSTLRTHQTAHVRPRFDGWIPFFEKAGDHVNAFLRGLISAEALTQWLNKGFDQARQNR